MALAPVFRDPNTLDRSELHMKTCAAAITSEDMNMPKMLTESRDALGIHTFNHQ
jgi:hypothetical protein